MRAIMTVTGIDHTGIIAAVATALADNHANIINVSQTLMGEYFTMIMQIECEEGVSIHQLKEAMEHVEKSEKMHIHVQSEAIFQAMHKL